MARRPARGLSSLVWSTSGLPATLAELEPCFAIFPTSSIVGACGQRSRALFEYTWWSRDRTGGRARVGAPRQRPPVCIGHSGSPRSPAPPAAPGRKKGTSGGVVPLNRVRTGGGRGASVPRPPGAGVPGWFGPGRRLGPPVALRHVRGPRHQPNPPGRAGSETPPAHSSPF